MQLAYSAPNYGDNRYVVRTRQSQEYLGVNHLGLSRVSVGEKFVFKKWQYDQIQCALADSNFLTLTVLGEGQVVLQSQESSEIASLIMDYKAAEEAKRQKAKDQECSIQ